VKYPKLGSNTDTKKIIDQLSIEELREQFENMMTRKYKISKSWMNRFDTGNYRDRDIERDWKGYLDCAEENNILV
jgi:hypothetical protein